MRVQAIDSFGYGTKQYKIGDEFDMPDNHAKLLSECIAPRVKIVESKATPMPMEEQPKAKIETASLKADEPAPAPRQAAPRRRYMRRDMTPQE